MIQNDKGIYPNWVNDAEIINQVLKDIISAGGRLPYSYVVNMSNSPDSQERMKHILQLMQDEKLILRQLDDETHLEIDIEGSRAAHLGYKKYHRIKKWDSLHKPSRIWLMLLVLAILGVLGFLLYFLLHRLRVI